VTVTGITGARKDLPEGMTQLLGEVKKHTQLPVAAGFGISRQEHMRSLRGKLDAAVVGSAIVDEIARGGDGVVLIRELLKACR
jgi:tryptophan synthase alpha chain